MVNEIELAPELAEALRRQYEIDRAEAGQKAPVSGFTYKGVLLESRWSVLRELEAMKAVLDAMPELMARRLESIWCDSKAGATYSVSVREGLWVPDLRRAVAAGVKEADGGHNGIFIKADGGNGCVIDPDWDEY